MSDQPGERREESKNGYSGNMYRQISIASMLDRCKALIARDLEWMEENDGCAWLAPEPAKRVRLWVESLITIDKNQREALKSPDVPCSEHELLEQVGREIGVPGEHLRTFVRELRTRNGARAQ